jgi:hypothetical protein
MGDAALAGLRLAFNTSRTPAHYWMLFPQRPEANSAGSGLRRSSWVAAFFAAGVPSQVLLRAYGVHLVCCIYLLVFSGFLWLTTTYGPIAARLRI